MAKHRSTAVEMPVVLQSEGHQLVGMLHKVETDKLLIMCHGFKGSKIENKRLFVEAAREFAQHNMSVLRFDFFGSGDSDGEFEETRLSHNIANLKDVLHWGQEHEYVHIAVLGISMGAATAILTLPDHPVEALITWSAVPDLKPLFEQHVDDPSEAVQHQERFEHDGWHIHRDFFLDAMQYDVQKALSTLTMPKFIVQGTQDEELFVHGFHQFRDIVIPPADFMEIPGAGHTYQTPKHRHQVIRQTAIWLDRHF